MNENLLDSTIVAAAINRARNDGAVTIGNEAEAAMRRERLLVASGEHPEINLANSYLDMVVKAQNFERLDREWFHEQAVQVVEKVDKILMGQA